MVLYPSTDGLSLKRALSALSSCTEHSAEGISLGRGVSRLPTDYRYDAASACGAIQKMMQSLQVLGICGSLRKQSHNRAALDAAGELMPDGMVLRHGSIAGIPIYNADDQALGWPAPVLDLGDAVRQADAVLIASPEYNFGVPGGLKNALDWLSRLPDQPFKSKPVAIMGAAPGPVGTARMQYDLRKNLHFLEAHALLKPEVFIAHAANKVDGDGRLVDETTRTFIAKQMSALRELISVTQALGKGLAP